MEGLQEQPRRSRRSPCLARVRRPPGTRPGVQNRTCPISVQSVSQLVASFHHMRRPAAPHPARYIYMQAPCRINAGVFSVPCMQLCRPLIPAQYQALCRPVYFLHAGRYQHHAITMPQNCWTFRAGFPRLCFSQNTLELSGTEFKRLEGNNLLQSIPDGFARKSFRC